MTPDSMREYLAAHAPELVVVELPEAHTTEYISREWKVLPAQAFCGRNHPALPRFLTARILRCWAKAFRGSRDR